MGILDDAIREHLELKRSHGASEEEVRRKETEAFGAPRADAAPAASAEAPEDEHTQLLTPAEHAEAAEPGLADLEPLQPAPEDPYAVHPGDELVPDPDVPHERHDAAEDHEVSHAAEAGAGMLEARHVDPGPPMRPHEHHHDEQHPALVDHDHIGGEEHAPEPVFGHGAEAPAVDEPPIGDPPLEQPEIDEPAQEPAVGDEEDVLEETPEFLQDAPEHDRLWFEQKPPRDFDFGE